MADVQRLSSVLDQDPRNFTPRILILRARSVLNSSSPVHNSLVLGCLADDIILLLLLQKFAAPDEVVDVVALLQPRIAVKCL